MSHETYSIRKGGFDCETWLRFVARWVLIGYLTKVTTGAAVTAAMTTTVYHINHRTSCKKSCNNSSNKTAPPPPTTAAALVTELAATAASDNNISTCNSSQSKINFCLFQENNLHNTIFVDQVYYTCEDRENILALLKKHLFDNIVKIGSKFYKQVRG